MTVEQTHKGGQWLLQTGNAESTMTPEKLTDEHRLIAQTAAEFVTNEVLPVVDRLEQKDWAINRTLVARCGAIGLFGTNVPEAFGGVDLDKVSSLVLSEQISRYASFGATFGAQANLTITPILMFGTDEQKTRYLPRLVSGEIVGAYCLSESGSGSDALGAKCRAAQQPDGSFVLSGEKMWITNGGFADLYIVFAKVDGTAFTAFIVERAWTGVASGKEEHKMGLHGSSTTPVILQDVAVPAANVLGEVGKGHKVAFNVLNFGRFKLGAMCSGAARLAIAESAKYASARRQFDTPLASFGAIRHKLGEMTAQQYALESLMYRTAGLVDEYIAAEGGHGEGSGTAMLQALEEYAVEASIAKVMGSEALDYILDENLQIHGGNGFVKDYPAEGHYRDARVNRIFEGTNEINRLLIPGMLIKRAMKGDLPFAEAAARLRSELTAPPAASASDAEDALATSGQLAEGVKKVALLLAGAAMERFGAALDKEQEVVAAVADAVIAAYASESAVLRASDARARALPQAELHADAAATYVQGAAAHTEMTAREALAATQDGDALRISLGALRRLLKATPVNTVALRRRLADETTRVGRYIFFNQ